MQYGMMCGNVKIWRYFETCAGMMNNAVSMEYPQIKCHRPPKKYEYLSQKMRFFLLLNCLVFKFPHILFSS